MSFSADFYSYSNVNITGEPKKITVSFENENVSDPITIYGMSIHDPSGIFNIGAFSPCLPMMGTEHTRGTPVVNPVPAWGTATQSVILYPPGNEPVTDSSSFITSGTYTTVAYETEEPYYVIPAGGFAEFEVEVVSNIQGGLKGAPNRIETVLVFDIETSEGDSRSESTTIWVESKPLIGLVLTAPNTPPVITRSSFSRPQINKNFDFGLQAFFKFEDGSLARIQDVPYNPAYLSAYTSSEAAITTVASGAYTTTKPGDVDYSASVGPQFKGGGGACTLDWSLIESEGYYPYEYLTSVTYDDTSVAVTGNCQILACQKIPVSISLNVSTRNIGNYGVSANTRAQLSSIITFDDGSTEIGDSATNVTYTFSSPNIVTDPGDQIGWNATWSQQVLVTVTMDTAPWIGITDSVTVNCIYDPLF